VSGMTIVVPALAALAGACLARASVPDASVEAITLPAARRPRWLRSLARGASDRSRRRLATLLGEARSTWTEDEVIGLQRLAIGVTLLVAVATPVGLLAAPLVVVIARAPEIVLRRAAKRRRRAAERELPLFLDLLSVATNAGLAPQLAVRRATEPLQGPLADELSRAIVASDLGRRWRDELRGAAERSTLPDLRRAVDLLARNERLGSSIADETARLAADVRETRRARATDRARAAPVKMLFPLVFLILPAFLLLTVVPVLLTTVRSIG
jgi:pilus assembly protein TadC